MTRPVRVGLADAVMHTAAAGLAVLCIGFAAYKVFALRGIENPPADMGLNFPAPRRRIITDAPQPSDPVITHSISRAQAARPLPALDVPGGIRRYHLLAVIDGAAILELVTERGTSIRAVPAGSPLPGTDDPVRIFRADGGWMLVAGPVRLTARDP